MEKKSLKQKKNIRMKNIITLISLSIVMLFAVSCEDMMGDFLEKAPGVDVTEDTIFSSKTQVETFLYGIYEMGIHSNFGYAAIHTPKAYANEEETIFAGASDEAETCAGWYRPQYWNDGTIGPNKPDDARFVYRYEAIRKIGTLIERIGEVPDITDSYQNQLIAEAKVIRALNYFEMMKRYGGMPIVGVRLQVDDEVKIPRAPLSEMLNFMLKDLEEAFPDLPPVANGYLRGRVHQGVALALKSKILLYAASPLFNTDTPYLNFGTNNHLICLGYNGDRWKLAAEAARDALKWATDNGCSLITDKGAGENYRYSWEVYDNSEIILAQKGKNYAVWNRPWSAIVPPSVYAGSSGQNGITPLLNFVMKYEDRNGNKVVWDLNNGGTDLQEKMAQLDRRFDQTLAYNMSSWNVDNPVIELWQAGDGITQGRHVATCHGGFWLHKLFPSSIRRPQNETPVANSTLFQLNEIYLNYAEAMYKAYGEDNDALGYGLTARGAINIIRDRSGQPKVLGGNGIYANFEELIRNERAIELAFDNHRFWDVRRWMIAEEEGIMDGAMYGIKIHWIDGIKFRYEPYVFETRTFNKKMYLHPFPTNEVNIGYLVQNPGY